jgi:phosphotransferase system  glucose/maltose/N-acetylglucosamine-specific IIC component
MEEKVILKRPPKSPALAGILSFFFPGTGALYNGQPLKFLVVILGIAIMVTMLANEEGSAPFLGILLGGLYFYQFIDAIVTASAINRKVLLGEEVDEIKVEELPEFVRTGSVFWGIVLMILGVVFLMANFDFLVTYSGIWNLWPLVVIIFGVKLVVDYMAKNKEGE